MVRVECLENPRSQSPSQVAPSLSNGVFTFVLNGSADSDYIIQASSNLLNGTAISTNAIPVAGSLIITDPGTSNQPLRFYRAKSQEALKEPLSGKSRKQVGACDFIIFAW
jgi:hypothetical protein